MTWVDYLPALNDMLEACWTEHTRESFTDKFGAEDDTHRYDLKFLTQTNIRTQGMRRIRRAEVIDWEPEEHIPATVVHTIEPFTPP